MEARETLTIACQVCADVCQCTCDPIERELYSELRKIGLDEEDLEIAVEVIIKHLKGDRDANEQGIEKRNINTRTLYLYLDYFLQKLSLVSTHRVNFCFS